MLRKTRRGTPRSLSQESGASTNTANDAVWTRLPGSAFYTPPDVFVLRTRLRHRLQWWRDAGACRNILRTIHSGATLEFLRRPRPFPARSIPVPPDKLDWVHQELDRGIAAGAFEMATCDDFVAPAFIHSTGKKPRLVIDFSAINRQCKSYSCRYEGLKDLRHLMRPGDWMFSLDLTDAFWHIPVAASHRKYLTFSIAGRTLQCAALPFGWTGSPLTFTKVVRAFVRHLRSRGIRCLPYVDDLAFFVAGTKDDALRARQIVEEALHASGLQRKPSKGQWEPSQRLDDHLGMTIDSVAGTFTAPPRRCAAVAALAKDVLCTAARNHRRVPSGLLRRFAGTGTSLSLALRSARFRLRSTWDCLEPYRSTSTLSRQAITDLRWWATMRHDHPENGMPIFPPATTRTLWADASSETGWGARLQWSGRTLHAHGYWRGDAEVEQHITWKELRTLRLSLTALLPEVRGQHVLLWEDNMPVVRIVLNGCSRSPLLMTELRKLWALMHEHDITLLPRYIRSADNPADWWSRWRDRSAWALNPGLFASLQRRAGPRPLTLDAFACRATAQLPRYCSRFPDPDAIGRDAFSISWSDEHVFINPPWELLPQALYKLRADKATGIIIAPVWPSATWWPSLLQATHQSWNLPHSRWCVRPAHDGVVEPHLHHTLILRAHLVDGTLLL